MKLRSVIVLLCLAAAASSATLASPPQLLRYQARLTDDAGVPLEGLHTLVFSIHDAETGGAALWAEGPLSRSISVGLLDHLLGCGVDLICDNGDDVPVPSSVFSASDRWIEITVDGVILGPRQRLASVPYAHAADRLGTNVTANASGNLSGVADLDMTGSLSVNGDEVIVRGGNQFGGVRLRSGTGGGKIDLLDSSASAISYFRGSVETGLFGRLELLDGNNRVTQIDGDANISLIDNGTTRIRLNGINGAVKLNLASGGTVPVYRNQTTGELAVSTSDARLKSNVVPLENVPEKLEAIRGVSFTWNKEAESLGLPADRREIGFLAQEVEAVFPEVVSTGSDGYKSVDYAKMTAVLVEALKQQASEIEALRDQVRGFESLDDRLRRIEESIPDHPTIIGETGGR